MQTLTDDLLDILASRFQAAARGYRCRIEIDSAVEVEAPAARVERTSNQSLLGTVAVVFESAQSGGLPVWSPSQPTRLVAPSTGLFRFGGGISVPAIITNTVPELRLRINGTKVVAASFVDEGSGTIDTIETCYQLNEGDYVELIIQLSSGDPMTLTSAFGWMHPESGISARVFRGTDLAMPVLFDIIGDVVVPFSGTRWDTGGFWSAGAPTRVTIPSDGTYRITAHGAISGDSSGMFQIDIPLDGAAGNVGGSGNVFIATRRNTVSNANGRLSLSVDYRFTAGQYIELELAHARGSGETAKAIDEYGMELTIVKIADAATKVGRTTNQAITSGVWTAIDFDAADYDDESLWTSGSQVSVPAGLHHVSALIRMSGSLGTRNAIIRLNGTTTIADYSLPGPVSDLSSDIVTFGLSCDWEFSDGDYIELLVLHDAGGSIHVTSYYDSPKLMVSAASVGATSSVTTRFYQPSRVAIDKSRRLAAAELDVELPNETGGIGVSPDSVVQTNEVIRVLQWYGDEANAVRTFTGLIDVIHEERDIRTVRITARDMMKRLIDQNFSATAPQNAGEAGAVRTAANGVYLETEASDIVSDILDRAGWPTDMRAISPTSYALDEYIIADGASWAEAIVNENGPTGLAGYDAWADELGVFHFAPALANAAPDSDTNPVPVYSYIVAADGSDNLESRNVLRLDHEIDDYELKTRVKVRGNLAIAVPAWTEVWHENTFTKPVGVFYDVGDTAFIKVLDRSTKKIYRYKTSSPRGRAPSGIWPLYVGGNVDYPRGLSADPADSTIFWVLDAGGLLGHTTGNKVHKYRKSDGAHLSSFSLPDGTWTDLKVTSSYIWLTSLSTDKTHRYSKTGTAGPSYTTTYASVAQTNPTGLFVDGTTLGLFFLGHARFLLVDETDPTTIDSTNALGISAGKISTVGSKIYGGEMNPDHAHLWAVNDDLGLLTYYALTEPSTTEVFAEVVDTDLEDELGFLAQAEDREHDTHPSDPDHPFEIRRATLTLEKTITNIAQATETAMRVLEELAHRRETVDFGIVGNPGVQRGDLHQLTDPITGIAALYILDTYRDNMDNRGYLGTAAYVPYSPSY